MLLTEEEAKKKHCCTTPVENTMANWFCEGSGCMAWRWGEQMPYQILSKPKEEVCDCFECGLPFMMPDEGSEWVLDMAGRWKCPRCGDTQTKVVYHPEPRKGFCGLAGEVKHR